MKRHKYKLTHPEADEPIIIKAFNERRAWIKMERKLIRMIYGDFAILYNRQVVSRLMKQIKCELINQ